MGLKKRLIAKLLIEDGLLVKYKNFTEHRRVVGSPASTARLLADQGVDEFMIVDVGQINPTLVREVTDDLFTPVTMAGSIDSVDLAAELIRECGADKVVIRNIDVADNVAIKFGQQAVVWSESYHGDAPFFGVPDCFGEIILTSIDRDGHGAGLDVGAARFPYTVPVTLAGGCGKFSHIKDAFDAGADGVAVSTMWVLSSRTPINTRSYLLTQGVNIR